MTTQFEETLRDSDAAQLKNIPNAEFIDGQFVFNDYGKFEAKASPFRAGMKPTNSIQPPTVA